jgi:hypothetical protein
MVMGLILRSSVAELRVLKVKVAELSANEYLMADFLSWGKILSRSNHR